MKPIYLEMNYFGPHEHSVIDFRKLEEAPIFLIGGDTGAGKSTIFDAMTFALFGSTTNDGPEGRPAKDMRSQFAPDDKATEVIFYFEQGNNLYKISRTPEQYLTKKRGTGLTKKVANAKLAIVEDVNGVEIDSIASKPVDVGTEIADILNLSADQFKKIILLPQNDFSEFLKSNTIEKEKILKKIFGTQLYSDFTNALKVKYDAASKEGKAFDDELNVELHSTKWTDAEKDQLDHEAADQRVVLLKSFIDERKNTLKEKNAALTKLRTSTQKAADGLQVAKDTQQKFVDLAKFKQDYQTKITDKKADITKAQTHVAELIWADPLKNTVRDLDAKTIELKKAQGDQKKLDKQVTTTKQAAEESQETVASLTAQENKFSEMAQKAQDLTTLIPTIKRIEELQNKVAQLQPKVTSLETALNDKTQVAQDINEKIIAKNKLLKPIDQLQQNKDELNHQKSLFVDTLTPLENAHLNSAKEVTTIQKELDKLTSELTTKQANEAAAKRVFDQNITERQKWMIAQLQTELKDDQPCVVCGSTDHSHMILVADASEAELKASMKAVDQAQDAYASAKKDTETMQARVTETKTKLTAKTVEAKTNITALTAKYTELKVTTSITLPADFDMKTVRQQFDQELNTIVDELTAANQLAKEIQTLTNQLQATNEEVTAIKLQLSTKKTELETTEADLEQTSKGIDTSHSSSDLTTRKKVLENDVATYQKQLQTAQKASQDDQLALSKMQTKLEDANHQLHEQQKQLDQLTKTIDQALQADAAQTHDQAILETWIAELNQQVLSKLQIQIANYQQERTRLETEIKDMGTKLNKVEQPDVTALQASYDQQKSASDSALEAKTIANTKLNDAKTSYDTVKSIMQKQGNFAKKFSEITSLYNIITGKDGNNSKLKLETYVVQSYLQRVLNYANDHFINLLSNNRYTFELADEGANKRTDHGLDINVFDNETGDSRPSGTLSGGETFIAALSIALSLSEVVQSSSNGVQIDALFVDEGFGSLDDETLTKAMQALETIGQNRMVGVISHIESMKQTIGQQIIVKKLGDGRSSVKLISK